MVFKKGVRTSSANLRNNGGPVLVMECWEDSLSPSQVAAFKQKVLECQRAQEKVKEAHHLAAIGMAVVTILDDPRKAVPPPTFSQPRPIQAGKTSEPQDLPRSTSPDIIFIGESPPTPKSTPTSLPPPTTSLAPPQQPRVMPANSAPAVPRQLNYRFPSYQVQSSPATLQIQGGSIRLLSPATAQLTPVQGTFGIGIKRSFQPVDETSPKRKKVETDHEGNWVPLDEFYYGKSEGDPSYIEEKSEFRFKCWYCNKMLYNNIKAMMHIQGHIDSSKQQNIDLSDLTQCKHCYRQFDTPFEMQTHVEKVHMNNVNVLMCRICERDHQSRHALMTHMRVNHNACEMPYICQLCKFRSSMYSDVVDHFKKKHDSSQHILCLYCLKVFNVKFVSQGWGQTQTYYGHLLKHQSKSSSKKCTYCRLTFVNPADCKNHKKRDHMANQKGIDSSCDPLGQDMMIKVPESGLSRKQSVKSLNAPAVSKVLDFGGTRFPYAVNFNTCVECKTVMGTPDHFRKHIECSMCRFATSCSIAYANHMMGFHSGQMTSLNLNIPWERPMKEPMHCLCGFTSRYGNKIANHLVYCTKRSCYSRKPTQVVRHVEEQEEQDPRHKPGASLLDVLGLVKKKNITTKDRSSTDTEIQRRRSSEEPTELVWKSSEGQTAPSTEEEKQEADEIPQELKGAEKWKTVKIKDPSTPSKASVFLGAAEDTGKDVEMSDNSQKVLSEESKRITIKTEKEEKDVGHSSLVDDIIKQEKEDRGNKENDKDINTDTLKKKEDDIGQYSSVDDSVKQEKKVEERREEDGEVKAEDKDRKTTETRKGENESEIRKVKEDLQSEISLMEDQNSSAGDVVKEGVKVEKEEISSDLIDSNVRKQEEDMAVEKKSEEKGMPGESMEDSSLQEDQEMKDVSKEDGDSQEEVALKEQTKAGDNEEESKMDEGDLEEKMEEKLSEINQAENIKEGDESLSGSSEDREKIDIECSEEIKGNTAKEQALQEKKEDGKKGEDEDDGTGSEKEELKLDARTEETKQNRMAYEEKSEKVEEDQPDEIEEDSLKNKSEEEEIIEKQHGEKEEVGNHSSEEEIVKDQPHEEEMVEDSKIEEEKQRETGEDTTELAIKGAVEPGASTESKSLADGGTKSVTQSADSDKAEREDSTTTQEECGQENKESTSASHSDQRSEHSHHGHHHHDNRPGDRGDHHAMERHRAPQGERGWSRTESHPQGNRHHESNRNTDNRHQYDRHLYDDRRHGYHDNRHGYHDNRHGHRDNRHGHHDNRHGYHDNRSPRGHWRGQGNYRGGFRDYR
uniref:Uncharacterized protein LOC111116988 isoform X1 n=1 Tax=Crassostrea virginica TaxID=6565 RepID=A0A8B8C9F0_CRAVI|nr:uncharacterized protein LOC111116988 isoform X1 [Crassostrea virginica]